jgi:hypothetical protein
MKIYKHFDYATPFCMAENERELAEIMRLKYPKACSNFETAVEFFARMVEDVRKFEAWKVIGFSSFEEFCTNELGKTLVEVEEIVEGVKLLGGNPTEEQAKAASKASRIRKLAEERPEMTRAEIAREVGATRAQVTQVLTKPLLTKPLLTKKRLTRKQPIIRLTIAPHRTAANIHAKMGADYCDRLCTELKKQLHDLLETDFGCHPAAASNEGRES